MYKVAACVIFLLRSADTRMLLISRCAPTLATEPSVLLDLVFETICQQTSHCQHCYTVVEYFCHLHTSCHAYLVHSVNPRNCALEVLSFLLTYLLSNLQCTRELLPFFQNSLGFLVHGTNSGFQCAGK